MKYFFTFLFFLFTLFLSGQTTQHPQCYKFRVYLKDKGYSTYSTENPRAFLSKRSIERKRKEKIIIDKSDFPISRDYFTLVEKAGGKIVTHSKWFNTLVVEVTDSVGIGSIESFPFVDSVKYIWRGSKTLSDEKARPRLSSTPFNEIGDAENQDYTEYRLTDAQFRMHNATAMTEAGFKGKGMLVGVIDAGFTNFDVIPLFESIKLGGYRDFVVGGNIFSSSDHGTKVLSTMATDLPGLMVGSAPEATYWLLRSEDVSSEFPVEEDYWVRAVEFADSLGVDVINTSLGYNNFDDKSLNYTHAELNGRSSLMSQAADKAYEKGVLIVVSAGNEGDKPWRKITPPADAKNILSVGAVGTDSIIAPFSSHGLTADGRIKPDLVSVGWETITIGKEGAIGYTSGTSLSSPFLTGLITSLWSVNPDLPRSELIDIVRRSSDRYMNPDSVYGYGIPDFHRAMKEVLAKLEAYPQNVNDKIWIIRPETTGGYMVSISDPVYSPASYSFRLLDESGYPISSYRFSVDNLQQLVPLPDDIRKSNRFLYFVVEEPFKQRVYKVEI
ncbi:S8 family peptidase [Proteiniphilum sp.]|uniref:S8 family peptidase n=1 Tax=Proteiniphilum sp. TaxID=1926877 RepID=UPI002B20D392|nr:S8 family serine peptidase [Proteiniphilum sp.]MEA4916646.1 S8 family serine peptidase [Proteiniphilum sp.]